MNAERWLAAGLLAVSLGAGAGSGNAATAGQAIKISAKNFMFSPAIVTVKTGSTVTWVNLDEEPHTVFSNTGLFRSSALDTKESYSFTFDKPGTYHYLCTIHPQMLGTIVVE